MWNTRYSFQVLMKFEFSRQIFEKCWKKIRPVGAKLFHADGRIDRHDEANSRFSKFCESAWKLNFVSCSEKRLTEIMT